MKKNNQESKATAKASKVEKETVVPSNSFKLTDVCKKLELNPKQVRARFRRLYKDADSAKGRPVPLTRWTFANADRKAVEALVTANTDTK